MKRINDISRGGAVVLLAGAANGILKNIGVEYANPVFSARAMATIFFLAGNGHKW